jgi:hypothetical protein
LPEIIFQPLFRIAGMIATVGYDGFLYSIGYLAGWIVALFVVVAAKRLQVHLSDAWMPSSTQGHSTHGWHQRRRQFALDSTMVEQARWSALY